jgi:hypothetical protein
MIAAKWLIALIVVVLITTLHAVDVDPLLPVSVASSSQQQPAIKETNPVPNSEDLELNQAARGCVPRSRQLARTVQKVTMALLLISAGAVIAKSLVASDQWAAGTRVNEVYIPQSRDAVRRSRAAFFFIDEDGKRYDYPCLSKMNIVVALLIDICLGPLAIVEMYTHSTVALILMFIKWFFVIAFLSSKPNVPTVGNIGLALTCLISLILVATNSIHDSNGCRLAC